MSRKRLEIVSRITIISS